MSDFERCGKCNDFHWTDKQCKPVYNVSHDEYLGDDVKSVHADGFYEAAIKYAKWYNSKENQLLDESAIIIVDSGIEKKEYAISAEVEISYDAIESKTLTE